MPLFLNIIELAQSLGVEESEVEAWIRQNGLPHIADRGRLLFDRTQVVSWAESHGLAAKVGFLAPERSKVQDGIRLASMLRTGGIWRDVPSANVAHLFTEIVAKLPGASPAVHQMLQLRLRQPNGISWAPVGGGFALPHLRTPIAMGRGAGILAVALLRDPLPLTEPAPDPEPITRLLFFVAPSPRAHLEILARFSRALSRDNLGKWFRTEVSDNELLAAIASLDAGGQLKGAA